MNDRHPFIVTASTADSGLADAFDVPSGVRAWSAEAIRLPRLLETDGDRFQGRVSGVLGHALRQWTPAGALGELVRVVHPPADWLAGWAGPDDRGALRNRLGYSAHLVRWATGRAPSPLSPHQEFEGPTGRH